MCGVIGILSNGPVNQDIYDALTVLQHRGQDAAGILSSDGERVFLRKDNGLIRDVFTKEHMGQLNGHMGIGHARYPTAGSDSRAEAQPFYVNSPFGIALGHNGNLTNAEELSEQLFREDLRQINTGSDSEILLNVFANELRSAVGDRLQLTPEDIFAAVSGVYRRVRGAYAVTVMIVGYGILSFRDPFGIRPLVWGRRESRDGVEHMVASESVALVYLARPDSILDDISVYKTRLRMGERLGQKLLREWKNHDIDVVIPVPDTSRTAALEMANELGIKYREGFIKNRYIGRTFIMPGQAERKKSVRQKLNVIDLEFAGKNVLLVDDSIVRGTTSKQIIQMAREAGAKNVYLASAAPPVRYPNVYGIDMPAAQELVAHNRSVDEICAEIGADRLIFQDLEDLIAAAAEGNHDISEFEASCFDGVYVTGDVTDDYLAALELSRSDVSKSSNQRLQRAAQGVTSIR